jgi:hypothetical protein
MNSQTHEPSISHALRVAFTSMLNDVHTVMPGTIESYDYTTCKASVQPALQRKYQDDIERALPIMVNVPVVWPRTFQGSISFPLNRGDGCLIVISERSMDEWLSLGKICTPNDPRKFDLSDGIAIPGLFAFTETSSISNNTGFQIHFKDQTIEIDANGLIQVGSNPSQYLMTSAYKTALELYLTAIRTFISACAASATDPVLAAAAAAFNVAFPSGLISPVNGLTSKVKAQ